MSLRIEMTRDCSGFFRADDYSITDVCGYGVTPGICCASTSRLFKLGRGVKHITAVFLKRRPGKYTGRIYTMVERTDFTGTRTRVSLEGYRGSLMHCVNSALKQQYNAGYRYVYVTRGD